MKPSKHIVISAGAGMLLGLWIKSWGAGIACFLSGVFLDLDHFLDYYIDRKSLTLRYKEFEEHCASRDREKVYVVLHSFEIIFLFWLTLYIFELNWLWIGLAVGASLHLL